MMSEVPFRTDNDGAGMHKERLIPEQVSTYGMVGCVVPPHDSEARHSTRLGCAEQYLATSLSPS